MSKRAQVLELMRVHGVAEVQDDLFDAVEHWYSASDNVKAVFKGIDFVRGIRRYARARPLTERQTQGLLNIIDKWGVPVSGEVLSAYRAAHASSVPISAYFAKKPGRKLPRSCPPLHARQARAPPSPPKTIGSQSSAARAPGCV